MRRSVAAATVLYQAKGGKAETEQVQLHCLSSVAATEDIPRPTRDIQTTAKDSLWITRHRHYY